MEHPGGNVSSMLGRVSFKIQIGICDLGSVEIEKSNSLKMAWDISDI